LFYTYEMSTIPVNIVVLAAGKGTRMHSEIPKVLHPLAGQPLLTHVIATARKLAPSKLCVVYGFGGEKVPQAIGDQSIQWVRQHEQKGTGHAMQHAVPHLQQNAIALVLLGDVPLIEAATCKEVITGAENGHLVLLTMTKSDPTGYGRIVRGADNHVRAIVEQKDANEEQRAIREVNTGIMAMPVERLTGWLSRLRNDNQQGEYYLTDIVAMAVADGTRVTTVQAKHEHEVLGINSKSDLAQAERIVQGQIAGKLLNKGVTLADPMRLDVRGTLECGRDVTIDVNCIFEGKVRLGAGVSIASHCLIRDSDIAAGNKSRGLQPPGQRKHRAGMPHRTLCQNTSRQRH
jgi:bifunctional UDP-N-acetylglucosamine pyrophosphorylase / glucosamine-1-phosphate N-acetyltransferase